MRVSSSRSWTSRTSTAIEGLSPAIAIEQKADSHNPRSTVGTVTEIYDYLRLLYARAGIPRCPDHDIDLTAQTVSQMVDQVLKLPEGTAAVLLAPVLERAQGRAPRAARGPRRPGLRARAHRRAHLRDGRRCPRWMPRSKHTHRGGGRPHARAARRRAAPRGILRDRAAPLRRHRAAGVPRGSGARGAGVLQPPRLPGVRLQRADPRAEAVLVQQPLRRLPELRWPGGAGVLRPAARGDAPAPLPRRRRGARLGPAQRSLLPAASSHWRNTTTSTSRHPGPSCPAACSRCCCTAAARRRSSSATATRRGTRSRQRHPFEGILPNLDAPLPRDRVADGARGTQPLPRACGRARTARARA